jgi:hypothetical protein
VVVDAPTCVDIVALLWSLLMKVHPIISWTLELTNVTCDTSVSRIFCYLHILQSWIEQ